MAYLSRSGLVQLTGLIGLVQKSFFDFKLIVRWKFNCDIVSYFKSENVSKITNFIKFAVISRRLDYVFSR